MDLVVTIIGTSILIVGGIVASVVVAWYLLNVVLNRVTLGKMIIEYWQNRKAFTQWQNRSDEKRNTGDSPVDVLCVTDESGDEAIYFDGKLGYFDSTIYMVELAEVINSKKLVTISHLSVKDPEHEDDGWPDKSGDLKPLEPADS